MIIDVHEQSTLRPGLPLKCSYVWAQSSTVFAIVGIPPKRPDGTVSAVRLLLTNADGTPFSLPCEATAHGTWVTTAAPSCFPTTGLIHKGIVVEATLERGAATVVSILGVGDLEIRAASADVQPGGGGDIDNIYVRKDDNLYVKRDVIDGVQHYLKQVMVFEPRIGWGATWVGDYILVDGEFVEV